jgi:F-type H+-transporting ATPase subunit delta
MSAPARLQMGLAAAEKGKQNLASAESRAGDIDREARARAQEVIAAAEKRAAAIVEEAKLAAKTEGDRIIAGARSEVQQEATQLRDALRHQVAALAVAGAEKILRREVDTKVHESMLSDSRGSSETSMAELSTIARPYAEAAFSAAADAGTLNAWADTLDSLAMFAGSEDMNNVVSDPRVSSSQQVELFAALVPGIDPAMRNFLVALAEHNRFPALPEIARQFHDLKAAREGSAEAHVTAAFPLDDAALARLVASLEKRFGKKILPQVSVDNALIGGVTVRVGDEVIDASVKGRLAAMDAALRN